MPLPSFLQPKVSKASKASKALRDEGVADDVGPVHDARARARRRLIGAVVLLAVGLVVFPLLFESKPRPLPMDIPIEVARKDHVAAAPVAAKPTPRVVVAAPPPDAGNEAAPGSTPEPAQKPLTADASVAPVPAPAPVAAAASAVSQPAASAPNGRFVVQVGAFTDATAVREARTKVEKLGLKTYTQMVETPAGQRTRVRVGPFETRDEADRASTRLKASGLPAYILAL